MMSLKSLVCFSFVFTAWTSSSNAQELGIESDICHTYREARNASITPQPSPANLTVGQVLDLLCAGEKALYMPSNTVPLVVILGRASTGKRFVVQYLAGKELNGQPAKASPLVATEVTSAGASLSMSIPAWFYQADTKALYLDCPGFANVSGARYDIPAAHLNQLLLNRGHQVKILLVEDYDNLVRGGEPLALPTLLQHVAALIPEVDKFNGSIALLANKVKTKDPKRQNIIQNVAEFLNSSKALYADRPNCAELKILKILLTRQEANSYSWIEYFPWVSNATDTSLQTALDQLNATINQNLNFTQTQAGDFGYALSDSSKLAIYQLLNESTNVIKSNASSLISSIVSPFLKLNATAMSAANLSSKFWLLFDTKQKLAELDDEMRALDEIASTLASGFSTTKNDMLVKAIKVYHNYTIFYQKASNNEIKAPSWTEDLASHELATLSELIRKMPAGQSTGNSASSKYVASWISVLVLIHVLGSINFAR